MPKIPRISVVTPSFNQGEFLEECIDSVLSQNYPNLEYVIMDGGSTDNSVGIIRKYEKYLAYWQSKPDGGQYDAINEGFKKTTGEIMAWLNSDDKYHHHALFKVAYIFTRCKTVDWMTGRYTKWDKDGDVSWIHLENLPVFSRERYLKRDYKEPFIQQESTFWLRSLWERAGGRLRTDLKFAGDLELWVRFFRFAPLQRVDMLIGGYREHGNQKAVLFRDMYIEEAKGVLDEEIRRFHQEAYKEIMPVPEPITVSSREIKKYADAIFASMRNNTCRTYDDADLAISYLTKKLNDLHMKPTVAAAALCVSFMRRIGVYDFYLRHRKYFSFLHRFFHKRP